MQRLDLILKALGVLWSIVVFVAGAVFFAGGEWTKWESVKNRVLDVSSAPVAATAAIGTKTCAVQGDTYIDSIVVPASWTPAACQSWAHAVGGKNEFRLGCVFPDGGSFGSGQGAPSRNCGW